MDSNATNVEPDLESRPTERPYTACLAYVTSRTLRETPNLLSIDLITPSVRNIIRKSLGRDSINEEISSIARPLSSCLTIFFSSSDIPFPSADLLLIGFPVNIRGKYLAYPPTPKYSPIRCISSAFRRIKAFQNRQ
uniref:Uncharacterized protein n=1 Tax=Opuntia streptacantha TaxID=393608 RepID=A0A7C9AQQ3_OPUST